MERQQFYAVWLCLFATAGSSSRMRQAAPSDLKQSSRGFSELRLETTEDLLLKVDEQEGPHGVFKTRVARYVPRPDNDQGPTAEWTAEQQRIAQNERDRLRREQLQRERTLEVQRQTHARLAEEERNRQRGIAELRNRYNNPRNLNNGQRSMKVM